MRQIQIERKLFELFGHRFFVFDSFQDGDLNIDDKLIYKYDNPEVLIEVFVANQFYTIWDDKRRLNAGVICAFDGDISMIVTFLKDIGINLDSYGTFDCGLQGSPRVIFLTAPTAMQAFLEHLATAIVAKKVAKSVFFVTKERRVSSRKKSGSTQ